MLRYIAKNEGMLPKKPTTVIWMTINMLTENQQTLHCVIDTINKSKILNISNVLQQYTLHVKQC